MAKNSIITLPDLQVEKYYEYPILSNSGLSKFVRFLTGEYDFTRKIKPITFRFGQLLHSLVYEPGSLTKEDHFDISMMPAAMKAQLQRMAIAARANPTIAAFLKHRNIIFEKPVYFLVDGTPISIRPDALIPALHGHDLKSTAARTYPAFLKSCVEYKYFRQMYLYRLGTGCKNYFITGISKTEPHQTFTINIKDHPEEMKAAKTEAHEIIRLYNERYPEYKAEALKLFGL